MLIVNVDTYITLNEANAYVASYYASTDPLRIQWEEISDSDKEVMLRKAFQQINSLPYTGSSKNDLPFPRDTNWDTNDFLKVKYAQAEQSIALLDIVAAQEIEERNRLRRAGVVKYKIGDLSEEFQKGTFADSNADFFGLSEKSYKYLQKWLQGGYEICYSIKHHRGCRS